MGKEYIVDPDKPRSRRAKIILAISVITNLSLLGFFKYFNFGVENYDALVKWIGLPELRLDVALRVTLPARHQLLHVRVDELRDRRVPRTGASHPEHRRLLRVRLDVPAARRGTDHPLLGDRRSDPLADAHDHEVRARRRLLQPRDHEEGPARQSLRQDRRSRVRFREPDRRWTPGTASRHMRFRSTSISAATPTWPSASG